MNNNEENDLSKDNKQASSDFSDSTPIEQYNNNSSYQSYNNAPTYNNVPQQNAAPPVYPPYYCPPPNTNNCDFNQPYSRYQNCQTIIICGCKYFNSDSSSRTLNAKKMADIRQCKHYSHSNIHHTGLLAKP